MRPARAVIDLSALVHNARVARQHSPEQMMAVVKADAYGHGLIPCVTALQDEVDAFAVAFTEEAARLIDAGLTRKPIVLLEGFLDAAELPFIAEQQLVCVVHSAWQIAALARLSSQQPVVVWLKVDTGMHRLGFQPEQVLAVWQQLAALPQVRLLGLSTHFARADEPECPVTLQQLQAILALQKQLNTSLSLANSAALLSTSAAAGNWTRPGIMLYGANPFPSANRLTESLEPVMTLESKIIGVQTLAAGQAVGYGGHYVTSAPTRLGIVAMGYADGYPRQAKNGTPVTVDGQPAQLVGRVAMDMLTVDITHLPEAGVGSRVELWGKQVSVDTVAQQADTIGYQLLCNLKRVPLSYC